MRITIINDDNLLVEGNNKTVFDFSALIDPSVHAVQWDGTKGTIEYKNNVKSPEEIDSLEQFQTIIDAAVQVRIDQAEAATQEEADRLAAMTHKDKRKMEYPDIGDQLDNLWRWAESVGLVADPNAQPDTAPKMLADIKAVKTKYPKV